MKTCAEHLPIELWISVFGYLELRDLFYAFSRLNRYFDGILASNHLSVYVRLRDDNKNNNFPSTTLLGTNAVLNRIICIEGITSSHNAFIPQFLHNNATKLIRLRSLSIKIGLCHERLTILTLQKLDSLESLSLECIMTQTMITSILTLPSLRICKLVYRNVATTIKPFENEESNIEVLSIKDYYGHHSMINIFLRHMPKLKKLNICGTTSTLNSLGLWLKDNSHHLQKLHSIRIKSPSGDLPMLFFAQLHPLTTVLKCLLVDIGPSRWDEHLLENFIDHSWPVVERVEKAHICIRGYIYFNQRNDEIRKKFDDYRQVLLSKNNQSNGCLGVQWSEENLTLSTIVEITIVKS